MDIYNNHIDLQKEMQKTQQVLADSSVRVGGATDKRAGK